MHLYSSSLSVFSPLNVTLFPFFFSLPHLLISAPYSSHLSPFTFPLSPFYSVIASSCLLATTSKNLTQPIPTNFSIIPNPILYQFKKFYKLRNQNFHLIRTMRNDFFTEINIRTCQTSLQEIKNFSKVLAISDTKALNQIIH